MRLKCLCFLLYAMLTTIPALSQNREINVDFNNEKGTLNTMYKECIGAGRANEGLRADWQQQLVSVKNHCGFKKSNLSCFLA